MLILYTFSFFSPAQATVPNSTKESTGNPLDFQLLIDVSAESYFFSSVDIRSIKDLEPPAPGEEKKLSYDLTGSKYKLGYKFQPVILASMNVFASWKFFSFAGEYKTDRVYKSGGSIEKSEEIASKLSKDETFSQILKLGLGYAGLSTSFRTVQFHFGKVQVEDVNDGSIVGQGNLELKMQKFELKYDFAYQNKIRMDRGKKEIQWYRPFVAYRYLNYTLPRIVYKFEDQNPEADLDNYIYIQESEPQNIKTTLHMLGIGLEDMEHKNSKPLKFIYQASVYGGAGSALFYMGNEKINSALLGAVVRLRPGISWQFSFAGFNSSFQLLYEWNAIYMLIPDTKSLDKLFSNENDLGARHYNFGTVDIYHGIQFAFVAKF